MDLDALTKRIDTLACPARQRFLADTARSLAGTPALTTLLAQLSARPGVTRSWALLMAIIAGDQGFVRGCLTGPDMSVATGAVHHTVRRRVDLDVITATLPTAPKVWRQALYRALRGDGAGDWADRLLPVVRQRFGDHEAAAVLPACGRDTVTLLLPELDFAVSNLAALARRHPAVVLAHLRRRLAEAGEVGRTQVWHRFGGAMTQLLGHAPRETIDLLTDEGPSTGLPAGADRWLAMAGRADPERVATILADPDRRIRFQPTRGITVVLRAASDAALVALATSLLRDPDRLAALLRGLPPARRPAILDGALGDRDLVRAGLPPSLLDVLPWRSRHAHAQRLLATRHVATNPLLRHEITARLPWADAEPTLRRETTRSTAADRATAYPLLIGAAAATRDPVTVGGTLASLTRLPNEQDPVRSAALAAVAAIPGWLFRPDDLPAVEQLAVDAVQARDASWTTRQSVGRLAVTLLRQGVLTIEPRMTECALRILERSGSHQSVFAMGQLDKDLPRGAEHAVFAALRTRVAADARVGRYDLVLSLATGLNRRAWTMPELQDHLRVATTASHDHTVSRAITLWLDPPATRDERVEIVFRQDPSTITIQAVADAIGRRCTDLLDRALNKPVHGRFAKRGVRVLPAFPDAERAWLPRQIARYAELLADLATTPGKPVWERAAAVRRLGRLPGAGADAVRPFLDDGEIAVVESALAALAWTDRPDLVLGELLGYADTDRARVAVYAATRAARSVAPADLIVALRPLLSGRKVTARKEAVRLIAEHRVSGAVDELAALWADPGLHRDVRRAIVSAARWVADDERVWPILTEATTAGYAVATGVTEAGPHTVAERHRPRYGALVRAVAGSADPDIARIGLRAWSNWSRWDGEGAQWLGGVITDLATTATWREATDALIDASAVTGDPTQLRTAFTTLARAEHPAADRDEPGRQRITYAVEQLAGMVRSAGESLRRVAETVAMDLAAEPTYRTEALTLAMAALPQRADLLPPLRRIADLADRPILAWEAANGLESWLAARDRTRPDLLATARALTDAGALLAVAITAQAGDTTGWPAPWRALLTTLRAHPDPDVRDRALRTTMVPE
ncbi:MAG TPA: hypothetical protein VFW65_03245 [Pseudonocardiaceae bacterium]|nr:hypothetical protein [Pseudonocardiaceae bacterium]